MFLFANVAAQNLQTQAQDWTSDLRTLQPHVSNVEITLPAKLNPIAAVGAGKDMHISVSASISMSLCQYICYIVSKVPFQCKLIQWIVDSIDSFALLSLRDKGFVCVSQVLEG